MKILPTAAALLLVLAALVALAPAARAHGRRPCCRPHRSHTEPARDLGPDLDGDGRVTTHERILYQRKQRFERLHG